MKMSFFSQMVNHRVANLCIKYISCHQYLTKDIQYSNILIETIFSILTDGNNRLKKNYLKVSKDRLNLLIVIDDMENKSVNEQFICELKKEENRLLEIIDSENEKLKV
jgi:hypothetical protein